MNAKSREQESSGVGAQSECQLGLGWSADFEPKERGAMLRLVHPQQGSVSVEIAITADGPVIRASAAALEIQSAGEIRARCERFAIDARESVTVCAATIEHQASEMFRAEGRAIEIDAKSGDVRIQANDDVRVVGEKVLLNCEPDTALPSWLPAAPMPTLPREETSGDADVLEELTSASHVSR